MEELNCGPEVCLNKPGAEDLYHVSTPNLSNTKRMVGLGLGEDMKDGGHMDTSKAAGTDRYMFAYNRGARVKESYKPPRLVGLGLGPNSDEGAGMDIIEAKGKDIYEKLYEQIATVVDDFYSANLRDSVDNTFKNSRYGSMIEDGFKRDMIKSIAQKYMRKTDISTRVHDALKGKKETWFDSAKDIKRNYVDSMLKENSGNISHVAEKSGLSRENLSRTLEDKLGLNAADYAPGGRFNEKKSPIIDADVLEESYLDAVQKLDFAPEVQEKLQQYGEEIDYASAAEKLNGDYTKKNSAQRGYDDHFREELGAKSWRQVKYEVKSRLLADALVESNYNISYAAEALGITERSMKRLMGVMMLYDHEKGRQLEEDELKRVVERHSSPFTRDVEEVVLAQNYTATQLRLNGDSCVEEKVDTQRLMPKEVHGVPMFEDIPRGPKGEFVKSVVADEIPEHELN